MRTWRLGGALAVVLLLAACGGLGREPALPGGALGIEVLGIELLAGGDLARLDYRVIDFERARRALTGEIRVLVPETTGGLELMSAGRLGPLRQKPSRSGRKQFIMFRNTGRILTEGDTAVLVIGEARLAGIPVN